MHRRPGCEQQRRAEVPAVRHVDPQPSRPRDLLFSGCGRLGNNGEVADELAAAPEVAGDAKALELGPDAAQ